MSAGYLRQCVGKRKHETRQDAEDHRRSMIRQGLWSANKSNVYRCLQCGSWHTGRTGHKGRGTK